MKRIALGLAALSILASTAAFATDAAKTDAAPAAKTHRQEMHDKWANATPEERAKMKARHHRRMAKMHEAQAPMGLRAPGFREDAVIQH